MGRALSRPLRVSAGRYQLQCNSFIKAVCGCRLNPSLIGEVFSSLAARCISQSGSVLRRLYLPPQPHTTTIFPRDERLIYTSHHPVRWPYRRRPHLLNYISIMPKLPQGPCTLLPQCRPALRWPVPVRLPSCSQACCSHLPRFSSTHRHPSRKNRTILSLSLIHI